MTAITSDNRGHDGLRDIFWWFSTFILMQENSHKPSGIPGVYFRKGKRP
jgi:hypothetical protein